MPTLQRHEAKGHSQKPRVMCYHQTHYHQGEFVSILPLLNEKTGITHVIIAAIHLNEPTRSLALNDDPYTSSKYHKLWHEVEILQSEGVKVLGMLGGAHPGSFTALDGDVSSFDACYEPLRQMLIATGLDGLDLDVEEDMSLPGIIRLIDRLKSDFGHDFLVTLAPVATALQDKAHLSGFNYEELEKAFGNRIAWYNTQFYCGWGYMDSTEDYESIMDRGWPANKVVIGLVTNPENGRGWIPAQVLRPTLSTLTERYPNLGGVIGWEYFNSITTTGSSEGPWRWARTMNEILRSSRLGKDAVGGSISTMEVGEGKRIEENDTSYQSQTIKT